MFDQLGWENATIKRRFVTYRELTLEFLISLVYIPEHGYGLNKGLISFRLFSMDFTYTRRDLADLLGFPSGPFIFNTRQEDLIDDIDLDDFWGCNIRRTQPKPE
jgi:hypothetical protein